MIPWRGFKPVIGLLFEALSYVHRPERLLPERIRTSAIKPIVLLPPTKLFDIPEIGASFFVVAIYDVTTWLHLARGFLISFVHPFAAFSFAVGSEASDGTASQECIDNGCKQGGDVLDLAADVTGMFVFLVLQQLVGLPSLIGSC